MVKLTDKLYVGNKYDFFNMEQSEDFAFCLCAKTLHKQIAKMDDNDFEGYVGNMPKDQKEYLIAERKDRRLIAVNLIDAPVVDYIPREIIYKCISFIEENIENGKEVLVVCDQGKSRSVGVAFMYLVKSGFFSDCESYSDAYAKLILMYGDVDFGKGINDYVVSFCKSYF